MVGDGIMFTISKLLRLKSTLVAVLFTVITVSQTNFAQQDSLWLSTAWSPNGQWIASVSNTGAMQVWNANNGETGLRVEHDSTVFYAIAWSPDSQQLAFGGEDRVIYIWDIEEQVAVARLEGARDTILAVDWSPDGQWIASASQWDPTALRVWNTTGFELQAALSISDAYSVDWNPYEPQIAVGTLLGLRVIPSTLELNGLPITAFDLPPNIEVGAVAWNFAGTHVAAGGNDGTIYIINAADQQITTSYAAHSSRITAIAWNRQDDLIASYGPDGIIAVQNAYSGERVNFYEGNEGYVSSSIAFSPYGGRLAFGLSEQENSAHPTNAFDNGSLEVAVPDPTLDRLADIQAACVADAQGVETLAAPESTPQPDAIAAVESLAAQEVISLTIDALPAYIAQVEALLEGSIPPACAADLIAVAAAVIAEGSAGSE
jgi:WD40 repeat protein